MKHLPALILAAAICLAACGGRGGSADSVSDAGITAETVTAAETASAVGSDTAAESDVAVESDAVGSDSAAETGTAVESDAAAETDSAAETEAAAKTSAGTGTGAAAGTASGETDSESATEEALTVTQHKQEGKHIVTAGSLTISVPTTFEGLEQEGAEFQGDREIVRAGRSGSCRVKYRGAFNSIQLNVHNNTDYDMAVRDCTICGIEIGSQEPDSELTLYGIPMGATRQQIADVYGEPFSKTFDDENHMSNMVYQFGTDIYSEQVVMIIFRDSRAVAASYDDFEQVVN